MDAQLRCVHVIEPDGARREVRGDAVNRLPVGTEMEIETFGGFLNVVDPKTRQVTDEHRRFVVVSPGTFVPKS
jgi:hypothetical protein